MTKLADWLYSQRRMSPSDLQARLGIADRSVLHCYLTGKRRPRKKMMERIKRATGGHVTHADFDGRPPKCAVVIVGPTGKSSVVLPWSTRDARLKAAYTESLKEPIEGDGPSELIKRVLRIHAGRAKYLGDDRFMYDGRPTDLRRLVQMANEMLVMLHLPPIDYPIARPKGPRARTERHSWGLWGFRKRKTDDNGH